MCGICGSLFVVCCVLFAVLRLSLYCMELVVWVLLLVARCWLVFDGVERCCCLLLLWLHAFWCPLFVAGCVMRVVRCLLFRYWQCVGCCVINSDCIVLCDVSYLLRVVCCIVVCCVLCVACHLLCGACCVADGVAVCHLLLLVCWCVL